VSVIGEPAQQQPATRMRLRLACHEIRDGGALARVLVPAVPLRNTWVFAPNFDGYGFIWSNRADLLRLGALFRLAAVSPHSAVHVPVPSTHPIPPVAHRIRTQNPVALLVAQDATGLRPSQWPALRRRLGSGVRADRTMSAPAARSPAGTMRRVAQPGGPPPLRLADHAATLTVIGPPVTLLRAGDILTEAGDTVAISRRIHSHGEDIISTLTGLVVDTGRGSGDPRERRFEFDVYAHEPIFHKARWNKRPG
jgi:hypothetical protein